MTHTPTVADAPPQQLTLPYEQMEWLLDRFVDKTPGVTHALLVSKDGLTLLVGSSMGKDWADTLAASISGHASLAHGTQGPNGVLLPAKQIIIERPDALFFIMVAGEGQRAAFSSRPQTPQGMVDTVLGVLAHPHADAGAVGYAMGQLIKAFASCMQTPVRQEPYGAEADGARTGSL
jgi:predicted regulator of Ras-like GTPase activity (Roadblock/LC7/MglB family)